MKVHRGGWREREGMRVWGGDIWRTWIDNTCAQTHVIRTRTGMSEREMG